MQAAECYCDYIINVMRQDDGDCNMACNGDSSETCGGPNRLTVYQYNGTAPLGPVENPGFEGWMSIGCYTDGAAARTLTHQAAVDGGAGEMSVRACTTACDNAGYKFAGVEYGQECCQLTPISDCRGLIFAKGATIQSRTTVNQ